MGFRKKKNGWPLFQKKKQNIEPSEGELTELQETQEESSILEELKNEPVELEFEKIDVHDDKARISYLERLYESIQEAKRHCGEIKFEYAQVTSYLKDIQLIDQAPDEEKTELLSAARQIVELTEERRKLQRKTYKMTDAQKHALENYEEKVSDDIKKLHEYEDYQMKIRNDLRQLSSEKNLLLADKRDIIRRQHALKTIGKCLTGILIAIGAMLLALVFCFKVDITMPFVAAVVFAFLMAAIILNEARKNRLDMVITEKKCSRAVMLSNRVKIKHVNNTRTLDYMCHKYQIRNAAELEFVYGEYRKAKKEWAKQRESTIRLNENNQILMQELERLRVKDRDIWFSQAKALVDPKEMVEVRHDLNVRRQKLRDQMDYNTDIMEQCIEEMEKIRDESPDYATEVENILGRALG
jgi:VIT1/CCC1 family predicted Fe2+/Mn2+ transporter